MDRTPPASAPTASRDIFFRCDHCSSRLVVDTAAAGLTLNCSNCGRPTQVPAATVPSEESTADLAGIQRKLTENESQRTEVTGYINQLCIQLHRWKLRLQTLNERKTELEAQLRKLS
jgi:DNA-directed RNA polymerase subunit M/transcription elongation factor TFIIS